MEAVRIWIGNNRFQLNPARLSGFGFGDLLFLGLCYTFLLDRITLPQTPQSVALLYSLPDLQLLADKQVAVMTRKAFVCLLFVSRIHSWISRHCL